MVKRSKGDAYYEAMLARDSRFDGKFFVGVKTTGVYCRPICPARPKRENVEFFATPFQSEQAGYRPCLRCRPESAPRSPAWIGKSAVVQRALRHLHDETYLMLNEGEFASRFGMSSRHLRRLFIDELGKTPKQLAMENRLNLARKLISETALPISEIVFASGFRSVRRFNDAFKDRFRRNPSEIRRQKIILGDPLTLYLSYRPPFDFKGLLHFYRIHAIGNLERFGEGTMQRVVCFDGKVGVVTLSDVPEKNSVKVQIEFQDSSAIYRILGRVRALLDLDSDPVLVANSLERDPQLKKILRKHPGIRVPSGWDGFEVAVGTILGQVVSVARGKALVGDLIELLGEDSGIVFDGKPVKLFPSPQVIATASLQGIKTTDGRRQALRAFAKAVADGKLSLEPAQSVEAFTEKVMAIKGIGRWTAAYMGLKVLRNTDTFPETDLILARTLTLHPKEVVERTSPWRGYTAALLWKEYAGLKKLKEKTA